MQVASKTSMSVLVILGRKVRWPRCVLVSHFEYAPTGQTDRRTDGRTPDHYITLTARRGQRDKRHHTHLLIYCCGRHHRLR